MPTPLEQLAASLDAFHNQVIAPAAVRRTFPLAIAAAQSIEPLPVGDAARAAFKPVKLGWHWGPRWSTCWFKLTTPRPLPADARRAPLALRFSTDTEALLWIDGVPHQGLDLHRDTAALPPGLTANGRVELLVEAACNHPFGASGLAWESSDVHRRWKSDKPGRLFAAELIEPDAAVLDLSLTFQFALALVRELSPASPPLYTSGQPWAANPPVWQDGRAEQVATALRRVMTLVAEQGPAAAAPAAVRLLRAALALAPAATAPVAHAVGHAHIDTAWLWPLRETRRKCLRTFSNVLRLMESDADLRFLCTQAQQYAFVERDAPALFRQIKRRVQQGRWEPGGAMWVEPDCNVPSGESLARQLLHGHGYFASRFGNAARQRFAFLPDTFGFPAQLPQLLRLAGLDTFITNKMSWNDSTPYPHTHFRWLGLDGTPILAHFTPGHDYNASISPRDLRRAASNHRSKQIASTDDPRRPGPRFLQPFGLGDGGGGPTHAMLHAARLSQSCDALPRVQHSTTADFCDALHADIDAAQRAGTTIPEHRGELYLELHRGTLTSQAWLKRANNRAEDNLRLAELLIAGSPTPLPRAQLAAARRDLDEAWKLVLLNQFHDILPGSSIGWVYDDARRDHARVQALVQPLIDAGLRRWAEAVAAPATSATTNKAPANTSKPAASAPPALVLNPASVEAHQLIDDHGTLRPVYDLPPLTIAALAPSPTSGRAKLNHPVVCEADAARRRAVLSNGWLRAEIDALGQVVSLKYTMLGREYGDTERAPRGSPLNRLVLHDDRPAMWDAWDIDRAHAHSRRVQTAPATRWRVTERSPLRAAIEITRPIGKRSTITQLITLDTGSVRLDIRSHIDWQEEHTLLRAEFPTTIQSDHATFQTQFGRLRRPTTPHPAAFEVPCQRWMELSDGLHSLAVLNEATYGASVQGSQLALTLLRSPRYPDPAADIGEHEIFYSLMPQIMADSAEAESEALTRPCIAIDAPTAAARAGRAAGRNATLPTAWSPITLDDSDAAITVSAFKPAEDPAAPNDIILRLVEVRGQRTRYRLRWNIPVKNVHAVDLLERPLPPTMPPASLRHNAKDSTTTLEFAPFQIITLRATRR